MPSYIRLFADDLGESHFEEIALELTLTEYAPPAAPLGLSPFMQSSEVGFMNAPSGWSSDWHPSSGRNLFFVLSGEWEVTASDGESRRFATGSVLLVEDTHGKGHRSRVTSGTASLAAMVSLTKPGGN